MNITIADVARYRRVLTALLKLDDPLEAFGPMLEIAEPGLWEKLENWVYDPARHVLMIRHFTPQLDIPYVIKVHSPGYLLRHKAENSEFFQVVLRDMETQESLLLSEVKDHEVVTSTRYIDYWFWSIVRRQKLDSDPDSVVQL